MFSGAGKVTHPPFRVFLLKWNLTVFLDALVLILFIGCI